MPLVRGGPSRWSDRKRARSRSADTVDEISGGRLVLALGAGWHEPEFAAFGFPFDHRYARFVEALAIVHALLRTGRVDFAGTYYQARDCELRPRGPRLGGPPLMIGTVGEKMLRLAARFADRWNVDWRNRPEEVAPHLAALDRACAAEGRDPATLERTAGVMVNLPGYPPNPGFQGDSAPLSGTSEEVAEVLRAHARAGIGQAMILLNGTDEAGVETFAPVLEALDHP
jgi:alkanesulfonate monooxygenase SsuD/methylene tetrahydromethanopterin reductase-like flavin-dependent oxidoreductase (luciferase family)